MDGLPFNDERVNCDPPVRDVGTSADWLHLTDYKQAYRYPVPAVLKLRAGGTLKTSDLIPNTLHRSTDRIWIDFANLCAGSGCAFNRRSTGTFDNDSETKSR